MEAARLRRARRRMRTYFLGSGVIMALLFLLIAAFVIRWLGVEQTSYLATLVFGAAVLAGGVYGIIFLSAVIVHIVRRIANRQPVMEIED